MISRSIPSYSIEFSPDSHDQEVRNALGRRFDTASMEKSVEHALENECSRFDLFFMIGLPEAGQEERVGQRQIFQEALFPGGQRP